MKVNTAIFRILILSILSVTVLLSDASSQAVPGKDENIPFLVTFGKDGETSWGDDDFFSIFFFTIPKDFSGQFYIKVFDPDVGGENDELQGVWNSKTMFSVYGGKGVDPEKNIESRGLLPGVNYKTGNLLASRVFGDDARYDNKYYAFGPFNPSEGDFNEKWNSYIFKIVCEGISGDDGNLYRYFLSRDANSDLPLEGANAFTYKYTFRMWNDTKSISHIYPYIDTGIVSIKQKNFDWDDDGVILVVSTYKQGISVPVSGEDNWAESKIPVEQAEIGKSLDFQFHKKKESLVRNNNVVISLENQRGDALQFFSSPIGGVPVYQPVIGIRKVQKK
ncbi:MAG TPA: hypothetical protein PKL65_02640 [Bacteroidales bacterium]|nr:hypothetical protein [Bacteroidales bacterium]HNR41104.1 hypothetical protein [Bacteroidales bacterium]HPM17660.1 hypothetical protein [Bacteroidales bacterium]HQG78440.1 hypothetical protein [Bacteroidales bacterium]